MLAHQQDELYLDRLADIKVEALKHYDPSLPGHGPFHEEIVETKSVEYRNRLLEQNVDGVPSEFVTRTQAIVHDTGILEWVLNPDLQVEFSSPERYSQHLASKLLSEFDVDEETIAEINDPGVEATIAGSKITKIGGFIVCFADLSSVSADEKTFNATTGKFLVEKRIFEPEKTKEAFDDGSLKLLLTYLFKNLDLSELPQAQIAFAPEVRAMRKNLWQLIVQRAREEGTTTKKHAATLGENAQRFVNELRAA